MQISRSVAAKRLLGRTVVGASLLVACLQAGAASALSFNFSFEGTGTPNSPTTVTGIVDGLVDNLNDQTSGLTVTITSATNGPVGTVITSTNYVDGAGFDVASGQVTGVEILFEDENFVLGLSGLGDGFFPQYNGKSVSFQNIGSFASLNFTPSGPGPASVPGPLPIFGAGAAFGWSRRLRRRIKIPA